ncbi:hypothetical protein RR45_GL001677 [Lactococcus chungangensis CAU 28 = DSM 22330]|uniref:Uncharacterized protein n=1 Tax=Pseudolactococcus chungangensis CAU 28 = DSM 22330 TaxID=1122154 RepID=A0ABX4I843_9LACT|nr:hypothetical protein RR45_GL001677 [Lactococcus chungangensis CAU 28 = DSM 22330]
MISEKQNNEFNNSYNPLYIWKNSDNISQFIFDGYFDNILSSSG